MYVYKSIGGLKNGVRNKSTIKGSTVEGYVTGKLESFISMYLDNAPTIHNRPQRNPDEVKGAVTRVNFDNHTLAQDHQYILLKSDKFFQLRM